MPVKRINQLPTPSGVAAGGTATFNLPVGPRYHVLWLVAGNTAKNALYITGAERQIIGDIRLKVNGKVQRTMSAYELDALNLLYGTQYGVQTVLDGAGSGDGHIVQNRLPIYLAEPWRKQVAAGDGLAWGTGNLSTFQLEVDLVTPCVGVTLSGFAELDNSITQDAKGKQFQAPLGIITKWFRQQIPINGTSANIQTFPKRDYYQQLSFFDRTAAGVLQANTITNGKVSVENFVIRDVGVNDNAATLVSRDMTPDADRFDIVFDHDDIINSALPMNVAGRQVNDFQVDLTLSDGTARNITCMTQRIGAAE